MDISHLILPMMGGPGRPPVQTIFGISYDPGYALVLGYIVGFVLLLVLSIVSILLLIYARVAGPKNRLNPKLYLIFTIAAFAISVVDIVLGILGILGDHTLNYLILCSPYVVSGILILALNSPYMIYKRLKR